MKALFLKFGNGGFGPSFGLLSAIDDDFSEHHDDDEVYLTNCYRWVSTPHPSQAGWKWPASIIPIIDEGCGTWVCMDCSDQFRIVYFSGESVDEGDPSSWDSSFERTDRTFDELILEWINAEVEEQSPLHLPFKSGEIPNYFGK